jgi:hypothetical protein
MTTTYTSCNICKVSGNISESINSDEINSNYKSILEKYKNKQYSMQMGHYTYCDLIHVKNCGDFHYCINCMRRDCEKMIAKSLKKQ